MNCVTVLRRTAQRWFLAAACLHFAAHAEQEIAGAIPVEVLPIDPVVATGEIKLGGVLWDWPMVALQPARPVRGVVVDDRIGDRVLVLTLLGKLERGADGRLVLDGSRERTAWCALTSPSVVYAQCFQDADGDGKFETKFRGKLGAENDPLSLNRLDSEERIEPLPYRPAAPEDLPLFHVGYSSCVTKTDADQGVYRYSTAVRRVDAGLLSSSPIRVCNNVAKLVEVRSDDSAVFQFGRFNVLIKRQGEQMRSTLIDGIEPGTLLAHVRVDKPLLDAVDESQQTGEGDRKPFLYAVAKPTVANSEVGSGEEVLRMEVAHGITGTLAVAARSSGWSKTIQLPVGTPMYGASMISGGPGSFDAEVVWCAPQQDEKGRELAWCFMRGPTCYVLESIRTPYVLQYISTSGGKSVAAPIVARGAASFGAPLYLSVRYQRANQKSVVMEWGVGKDKAPQSNTLHLLRNSDGDGTLLLGTLVLKITPSKDAKKATVSVLGTVEPGMNVVPIDAFRLFKQG